MYSSIRQNATFDASPDRIYDLLMRSDEHARFTGAPASMSEDIGAQFSAYGGNIEGVNLELVPGQRIVQMWRAADWPAGHYSTITYELSGNERSTEISFTQTGVPTPEKDKIAEGWSAFYWAKMQEALRD